ncbi:hypothetical protein [Microbacterium stercoris]|uniref:Uncharacterized protein n=1 Tax=Microbacterium stercoris TaxID=2820289 RepID=A0A939TUR5_9MICO|nr:hypothetical protein [Microbacterium stercoris]MBO3662327.1 hypothetical protein [Microbacterium stercoris]MBO3664319.1 hypothetical protein [Microbacterium stercoris]
MYILLALIAAISIGIGIHYLVPRRATRGVVLAPAISGAAAAVVYAICTWSGLGEASPWTWLSTIVVSALLSWAGTEAISRHRAHHDAAEAKAAGIA